MGEGVMGVQELLGGLIQFEGHKRYYTGSRFNSGCEKRIQIMANNIKPVIAVGTKFRADYAKAKNCEFEVFSNAGRKVWRCKITEGDYVGSVKCFSDREIRKHLFG